MSGNEERWHEIGAAYKATWVQHHFAILEVEMELMSLSSYVLYCVTLWAHYLFKQIPRALKGKLPQLNVT